MKAVIFDLDGVLIDSRQSMETAWGMVQLQCKIDIPFEDYFAQIGKPFRDILEIIGVPKVDFHLVDKVYDHWAKAASQDICFYEGVKETLEVFREEHLLAIVTSKSKERTDLILDRFQVFDFISCPQEGLKGKPAPDQLIYTLEQLNVEPSDAIYVGDMQTDYECANAAGVKFVHVKYGYGEVECEHSVNQLSDLTKLLD